MDAGKKPGNNQVLCVEYIFEGVIGFLDPGSGAGATGIKHRKVVDTVSRVVAFPFLLVFSVVFLISCAVIYFAWSISG